MLKETIKGALIASAVAGMFGCASTQSSSAGMAKPREGSMVVKCAGVNECKGKGACAGADNACKAQNSCKGKGWVETASQGECKDKGGTVAAM